MLSIRFVKKAIKDVINKKKDNLVRLRFDLMYASRLYDREKIKHIDSELVRLRNEITIEKNKKYNERDKEIIVKNEVMIPKLENKIKEYQELNGQIEKTKELIKQSENVIKALEETLKDKKILKNLAYGRTKETTNINK